MNSTGIGSNVQSSSGLPTSKRKTFDRRFTLLFATQVLIILILGFGFTHIYLQNRPGESSQALLYRKLATQLQSLGLLDQALESYAKYFDALEGFGPESAPMAFSIAQLYENQSRWGEALLWYSMVELLDPNSSHKDDSQKKVVALLERVGKVAASKRYLKRATSLDKVAKSPEGATVLAKVGDREIYQHELDEFLDQLPPELKKKRSSKEERTALLQKMVADELLAQKAIRLGLDQDPDLQKKMEQIRHQFLASRIVEDELSKEVKMDPSDLKNYFDSHIDRYKKKEEKKAPSFDSVKEQVERDYRMEKSQRAYENLVQQSLSGGDVTIYSERVK